MKRILNLIILICLVFVLSSCSKNSSDKLAPTSAQSSGETKSESDVPAPQPKSTPETKELTINEFDTLLNSQPISVIETKYTVQDSQYKSLYPDLLQAIIINNTELDIKDVVIAFVAWDENNLPVKIKGSFSFGEDTYVKKVNYSDINLIPGATYGSDSGFEIDDGLNISNFKAIVVSYESFDGQTWKNPYFSDFCKLFEGVKYSDDLKIVVEIADETASPAPTKKAETNGVNEADIDELANKLSSDPISVIETKYTVQDSQYKSLYPDLLQAIIKNNTELDIKDVVVAFVAWDENNLPVKIKGSFSIGNDTYVKKVNYSDINLIPGATYGSDSGFEIDDGLNISNFKAIVVSYESFDGQTWENPYFNDFCKLYEGNKFIK